MMNELTKDFIKRFRYRKDPPGNPWYFLIGDGLVHGDCEDFAITVGLMECGGSKRRWWWKMITFQMVLWYVYDAEMDPHAALWIRGKGWIDNQYPYFGVFKHYKRFPFLWPVIPLKLRKYKP